MRRPAMRAATYPGRRACRAFARFCVRGDLNPHALIRALAPQASASAYSATRTSGAGRSWWGRPARR